MFSERIHDKVLQKTWRSFQGRTKKTEKKASSFIKSGILKLGKKQSENLSSWFWASFFRVSLRLETEPKVPNTPIKARINREVDGTKRGSKTKSFIPNLLKKQFAWALVPFASQMFVTFVFLHFGCEKFKCFTKEFSHFHTKNGKPNIFPFYINCQKNSEENDWSTFAKHQNQKSRNHIFISDPSQFLHCAL